MQEKIISFIISLLRNITQLQYVFLIVNTSKLIRYEYAVKIR